MSAFNLCSSLRAGTNTTRTCSGPPNRSDAKSTATHSEMSFNNSTCYVGDTFFRSMIQNDNVTFMPLEPQPALLPSTTTHVKRKIKVSSLASSGQQSIVPFDTDTGYPPTKQSRCAYRTTEVPTVSNGTFSVVRDTHTTDPSPILHGTRSNED